MTAVAEGGRRDTFQAVAVLAGIPVLAAGFIAVTVVVGVWLAFVVQKLYGWFVVPLGAPVLSVWHVYGLLLMFYLITFKADDQERSKDANPWSRIFGRMLGRVVGISLVLLVGWLVYGAAS